MKPKGYTLVAKKWGGPSYISRQHTLQLVDGQTDRLGGNFLLWLEYVGMLNSIRLCVYCMGIYGGFLEWRYPKMDQNGWFLMENPKKKKKKKMDDLGVPPF